MKKSEENETICYNPSTGKEIGRSKVHSVYELKNIIDRAKKAQIEWGVYPVGKRIAAVKKIREYIVKNADEIAEIISDDNGKTRVEALATEVLPAAMAVSFYCSNAKKFLSEKALRGGNIFLLNKRSKIVRIPYGIVGIISPWNYPFAIPFSEVIMGLLAGNADPYRAAMGALWAGFQNSGQSCGGVERIYVHENIYDQFMAILKEKIDNLNVKDGSDYDSQMGCMTTTRQVDTVNLHIEDAIKKGATIYAQSPIENSSTKNFIPATVLTNVNHNMLVMKDETFGPVVGVMKFKNIEDAITLANDSYLGLTGSVWSRNQKYAMDIAKSIKAGVVTINDHLMSHGLAETPWGGFKESGIGRTHGKLGFDEMTQPMVIVKDLLSFSKKQLWWHPYSKRIYDGLKGLLDLLYNQSLLNRIKAVGKLLKILPRMFYKE